MVISGGKMTARLTICARILLTVAEDRHDEKIVDAAGSGIPTFARVRRQLADGGIDAVLTGKPQAGCPRALWSTKRPTSLPSPVRQP